MVQLCERRDSDLCSLLTVDNCVDANEAWRRTERHHSAGELWECVSVCVTVVRVCLNMCYLSHSCQLSNWC